MAHLRVSVAPEQEALRVSWRLDGVTFDAGDPVAQLPLSHAGAPTLRSGTAP